MNRAVNYLWLRLSISIMKIHDYFGFVHKKSAEIGHMTEGSTPFQKSGTKIFQFETLFCHITTNEILHINCVPDVCFL